MIGTILAGAAGAIAAPGVGGLAWRAARQRQVAKAPGDHHPQPDRGATIRQGRWDRPVAPAPR